MPTVARKAGTGAGAAMLASGMGRAQPAPKADHTARIAPTNLELVPGPKVRKEPGPVLRLREGRPYDTEMSGLMKDTLSMRGHSFAEVNFIASVPGPTSSTVIIRIMWMRALQD